MDGQGLIQESVRWNEVKTSRSVLIKAIYTPKKFARNKDTGHPVSQSDCSHGHWQNYSYYLCCLKSTLFNPGRGYMLFTLYFYLKYNHNKLQTCNRFLGNVLCCCFLHNVSCCTMSKLCCSCFIICYSGMTPTAPLK